MPIFEYACEDCNIQLEKYVSKYDVEVLCEQCQKPMKKIMTGGHKIRMDDAANRQVGKRYT